ncbi:MAG: butyrate kinase [Planctomycetales bacterium]|nr:butyrate kinase [Planctomycetales bacterium]
MSIISDKGNSKSSEQPRSVVDLFEYAGRLKASSVIVAGGERIEDLRLVESARDHGIIKRIVLVGKEKLIRESTEKVGFEIPSEDIVSAATPEEAAAKTVEITKRDSIDIVLKGSISSNIINRAMLAFAVRPTVSLVTAFDAISINKGKLMLFSDAGMTTVCNFGRMVGIINNCIDAAQTILGLQKPRIAILSANEKQVPSLPSTRIGLQLAERNWPDAIVAGPVSFDLATDMESVKIKGIPDIPNAEAVAGQADILICPGIDAGNILYKTLLSMCRYGQASLADITMGFEVPFGLLSRSDTLETRILSIAMCGIYAQQKQKKQRAPHVLVEKTPIGSRRVLVINPGSTSLKLAAYENETVLYSAERSFDVSALSARTRDEQIEYLESLVREEMSSHPEVAFDAVAGRGGFLSSGEEKISSGTYAVAIRGGDGQIRIEQDIVRSLQFAQLEHASNLGIPVAAKLAQTYQIPAFTVDPVIVDEFDERAEISGYSRIIRRNVSHALSVKAAAAKAALAVGRPFEDTNQVVAHLGGGITIAAIRKGRIVDTNIALLGGGPFTPRRAGTLPLKEVIDLCYSGEFTKEQLIRELTSCGGLVSYLGEHRMTVIEERIGRGDEKAKRIVEAMIYQISREIGAAAVAAGLDLEAIVLTGGLAHSARIVSGIKQAVGLLAPVMVFEGSLEMEALAKGALDVLSGRSQPKHYKLPIAVRTLQGESK